MSDSNEGFAMKPLSPSDERDWTVRIDGEERTVALLEIQSQFIGNITYGKLPAGYDGWVFEKTEGGGAVTIPYVDTPDGDLLVGLVLENRSNMGPELVWCVMGGFVDFGESSEEGALDTNHAYPLLGKMTNPNLAFFVADASEDEGVYSYGAPIPFEWIMDDPESDCYMLSDESLVTHRKVRFFHWKEAIRRSPDALARAAIAQLLAMKL